MVDLSKSAVVVTTAVGLLLISACARPQAVRDVASASQPIVVEIQKSGTALQQRFQAQRDAFAARTANRAGTTAAARAKADAVERAWRMTGQEARFKQLAVLREQDARIREDPLFTFAAAPAATTKADQLDLSGLKTVLTALDRLKGAERLTAADLQGMVEAVRAEQASADVEGGGETPAAPSMPQ